MGATVVEKIARSHQVEGPDRALTPGDMVMLRPRHLLTHDNTAAVMSKFLAIGAVTVRDPRQPVFALDHEIQNDSPANTEKYERIRVFAELHGIDFHPAGAGIGHQIMIERGYAVPGALVVASDSHANMYGAVGALGTPVVRTDAASIWATGQFWWQIPRTVQVVLEGGLRSGVSGKDVILTLCALYNRGEVLNAAVEFTGPGVATLDMSGRMSIANMTTEWGALTGWFPVDAVALEFLRGRSVAHAADVEGGTAARINSALLHAWSVEPPAPDPDAAYAARITLDLSQVVPFLAGPDEVQTGAPVAAVAAERITIDRAYLLSCVNGRLEDLEDAAAVLRGRQVAAGVKLYVAAASATVQRAAEHSGAWPALLAAGATPLLPGCGPCIGLGTGLLEDGEVGISATNRNFKGRMGARTARVYLASPRVVAESALAGHITGGALASNGAVEQERRFEVLELPDPPLETIDILPGFPSQLRGRLLFVPRENLNTDGIYGKDHTYRELSLPEMAAVVMQNYDPAFAALVAPGDILVGTRNFGTGSSREQAATALQAAGIALVVAESFSQTYLRNAFNNGFICVECAPFVHAVEAGLVDVVARGEPTVVPGDDVAIDFARGIMTWRGEAYRFPPLGTVPQALVVAGGVEQQVRHTLGLIEQHA
jgi:homoaconitate hydratase